MDISTDSVRSNTWEFIPKHPHMKKCRDRLGTFKDWPKQIQQTPHQFAGNGFFYTGKKGDSVCCFYCGVILKHWESMDIIMVEHRKWSDACTFLQMTTP